MTILPALLIASIGAAVTLLTQRWERVSNAVGLGAFLLTAVAATAIRAGDELAIGGLALGGSDFVRLLLVLGGIAGLLLALVTLTHGIQNHVPGSTLAVLALSGIAISTSEPIHGVIVATIGGLFGLLVTLGAPSLRSIGVAAREFRVLVLAGCLAIGAIAWSARFPDGATLPDAGLIGLAYLAGVAAVAIRFGAIPFHLWAARVADAASEVSLPLVMAWGPAPLAVVGLSWVGDSMAPMSPGLGVERALVVVVAALTVVLGSVAAAIHDDLEHVVGYGIIADAGFIVLALAAVDPTVLAPVLTYLLIYVVAKTAFAAWATATRQSFDARRLTELGGWARRSPPLALALLLTLIATVGLPGVAVWDARAAVSFAALGSPLGLVFVVAGLAPVLYLGRLFVVGYGRTTPVVAAGPMPWPRLLDRTRPRNLRAAVAWVVRTWSDNRAPISALWVLVLAGLTLIVALGGLGLREAAESYQRTVAGPG